MYGSWAPQGGGGGTLEQGYDAGHVIVVDAGPLQLTGGGTTPGTLLVDGSVAIASGASAVWNCVLIDADVSLSGVTDVTTVTGFNMVAFNAPTITDAGTITFVTNAATVYIAGAPTGSGLTITNAYALWVDGGVSRFDGVVEFTGGSAISPGLAFFGDSNTGLYSGQADRIGLAAGGGVAFQADVLSTFQFNNFTAFTFTQAAASSGSASKYTYFAAGHTGLTAGAEVIDVDFDLGATLQHATGAVATQRTVVIRARTYSFVGASTITDAATFYISGAPIAGANATITNSYALWVDAGLARFDGGLTISAANIETDTTTGMKIATATTQKVGFFNATPVVQGASVADASGGAIIDAEARTAINALISRIEATGLIATV